MKADIRNCSRCGKDHQSLELWKLDRPIFENGRQWTHWTSCPVTGESVFMREEVQGRRLGPSETKEQG